MRDSRPRPRRRNLELIIYLFIILWPKVSFFNLRYSPILIGSYDLFFKMTSVFHFCICLVIDHKFRHNIVVAVDHEADEIQFYISAFALLFFVLDMFCMTIS